MKLINLIVAGAAVLLAAAPQQASAQTVVPVPEFRSVELNGGGKVILRHGPVQRVTLIRGSTEITRVRVEGGERRRIGKDSYVSNADQLVIDACKRSCSGYDLVVEVVTPSIEAIAINGGGRIAAEGRFPRQANVGMAVNGGGLIDARALPVSNVGAAVSGGGLIQTRAESTLGAAIQGGGAIRYWGDPTIGTSIDGGGTVTRGG